MSIFCCPGAIPFQKTLKCPLNLYNLRPKQGAHYESTYNVKVQVQPDLEFQVKSSLNIFKFFGHSTSYYAISNVLSPITNNSYTNATSCFKTIQRNLFLVGLS